MNIDGAIYLGTVHDVESSKACFSLVLTLHGHCAMLLPVWPLRCDWDLHIMISFQSILKKKKTTRFQTSTKAV